MKADSKDETRQQSAGIYIEHKRQERQYSIPNTQPLPSLYLIP